MSSKYSITQQFASYQVTVSWQSLQAMYLNGSWRRSAPQPAAGSFLSNRDADFKGHTTQTMLSFLGEAILAPVVHKEIQQLFLVVILYF